MTEKKASKSHVKDEKKTTVTHKEEKFKEPGLQDLVLVVVLAVISIMFLVQVFNTDLHAAIKLGTLVLVLYGTAKLYSKLTGIESSYGMILLKSQRFIGTIDSIAKRFPGALAFFADVAVVIAFGVFSMFIVKKNRIAVLATGLIVLLLANLIVLPAVGPAARILIKAKELNEYSTAAEKNRLSVDETTVVIGTSVLTGYTVTSFVALAYQASYTANQVLGVISGKIEPSGITPGAVPVIPGITIPLFEGIIALMVVLVVHEGGHGIIARLEGIKINTTGIALIGAVPAGAFVDPDEKELYKRDALSQSRVIAAGPAANIISSIVLLFVFYGLAALTPDIIGMGESIRPVIVFVNVTILLSVLLNFMVGLINLLPVVMFDGYHLVNANVPHKRLAKAISYAAVAMFILIVIPLVFRI